jgi:hypothetical protein
MVIPENCLEKKKKKKKMMMIMMMIMMMKKKKKKKKEKRMGLVAFIIAWVIEMEKECTALKCPRVSARPAGAIRLEARYSSHLRSSSHFTQIILCLLDQYTPI